MWLVEFSLAHRIPVACFSCHKINKISISCLNYSRKQEILLKNLLQNQQNLKARGIYSCTGIYFFKSAMSAYKIKIAKEVPFVNNEQTSFAIFRLFYYNSPAFQQSIFKSYSALLYFTPVISFLPLIANNSETLTT